MNIFFLFSEDRTMERFNREAFNRAHSHFFNSCESQRNSPYQWLDTENQLDPDKYFPNPLLPALAGYNPQMSNRMKV